MENASFFPLKREKLALKCHANDCAMNVFNFLDLIPTKQAMQIANTTDDIYSHRVESFLTETFGVKFTQESMWEVSEGANENFGEKMNKLWDKLDEILPANKGIIVFIYKEGEVGHFAVIGKISNSMSESIYLMDPQEGIKYLILSNKMDQVFLDNGYEKVEAFMAHEPAKYFRPDVDKLHKQILYNKNMNNLYNATATSNSNSHNHLKIVLKQISKGVIIHHGQLIKGDKYQVINKITRQPYNIGIFDTITDGMVKFIVKDNIILTESFVVPLSDYSFIRIKRYKAKSADQKRNKISHKRKIKSI